MPLYEAVGGYPERSRSEETHRPTAHRDAPAGGLGRSRIVRQAGRRRFRLQAAGLIALAVILVLAILLPARKVHITADGDVTTVTSRSSNDAAAVAQAGIELKPGNRVEEVAGGALVVHRATEALVQVDGRTLSLRTQTDTIAQALSAAGIPLESHDSVLRNDVFVSPGDSVAPPPSLTSRLGLAPATAGAAANAPVLLEVRRAVPFAVVEDGHELQLSSSRETIATALRDVGVRLGPGDEVQPPLDTELSAGLQVHVGHAAQLVVTLPEGKALIYTLAGTVGEAIAASGIDLPADYRLEPAAGTLVSAGLAIHVVGISQEQVLETERIESRTLYEPDPSLPWGQRRVVQGRDGVLYRQYTLVYENGEVISRELSAEWYDPEPADTVIYYSMADAAPSLPLDIPDGLSVVGSLRVYATWYNPASAGRSSSDPSYGITATGIPVDRGVIAVDPSVIPLGTRLFIPGYGYAVAADTGGGIRGNMIDLGYPDGVVPDWISHWVDIYILGP